MPWTSRNHVRGKSLRSKRVFATREEARDNAIAQILRRPEVDGFFLVYTNRPPTHVYADDKATQMEVSRE